MAAKSSDLKLLGGWFSPFATRVKIALNIKGLEYQNFEEDLESKSDLLLRSNPVHKKIPVLIHGEKSICESSIIVEYIDEVWSNGPSILPQDAYDRAIARFWVSYIDDKFLACMKNILGGGEDEDEKKQHFEQLEEVFVRLEEAFNKCRDGKPFFGGNNVGFIDITFGSFLPLIRVIEEINGNKVISDEKFPVLANWAGNFAADSVVVGTLPEIDKLVLFTKALQQKWAAAKAAAK
ncbi:glutathione s-transferase [Stylosanthes scabra]|uniref:glutathione transferase n=1 Tax=Stylosanthes scabra TaxID=79078 RepID=A0ABU6TGJ6_9FABA|nr:glutathione s-transferase [Stylosanthes scabra]